MANIVTIFITICNHKNFGQKAKITIKQLLIKSFCSRLFDAIVYDASNKESL